MKLAQPIFDKKKSRVKNVDNFIQPPPLDIQHISLDKKSQREFSKQKDVRKNNEGDGVKPELRSQLYAPKQNNENVVSENFNDTKKLHPQK